MNRKIKLRYWSKSNNKYVTTDDMPVCCEKSDYLELEAWDEDKWEQGTDLKDKNGKEIYEGDVCKVGEIYSGDYLEKGFIGNVIFEDGCFQINKPNTKYGCCELDISTILNRNIEIIGNIHQNPELITNI
jgi:uncharacterized phage protein (TIGR01671 family)